MGVKSLFLGTFAALLSTALAQDSVSHDFDSYGQDDDSGTPYQTFRSNTGIAPPQMQINARETGLAPGLVFIGVNGEPTSGQNWPTIWDFTPGRQGTLVWTANYTEPFDFRTQTYKDEPVLTFWSGQLMNGYGYGTYYVLNQSYTEIAHFSPVGYDGGDLHEFSITSDDTALIVIYAPVQADLSSMNGSENGWIYEGVFQEIDIEAGELRFEWNASSHVSFNETYKEFEDEHGSEEYPWDFFHMNSVQKDANGDYLVSARVMNCVYKISGEDGSIIWRLGGKDSDFEIANDARFAFQHDVRWINEGQTRMTLFNNGDEDDSDYSRGLLLEVDQNAKTVELVRDFSNGAKTFGQFEGSLQAIDPNNEDTHFFIGYGSEPFFAELDRDGNVLLDVQFGATNVVNNYRAYKLAWQGKPNTQPDIHFDKDENNAYFSWNGATDVEHWHLYTANGTDGPWHHILSANRTGFETTVNLDDVRIDRFVRARAIDSDDESLDWTQATDGDEFYDASGEIEEGTRMTPDTVTSTTVQSPSSSPTADAGSEPEDGSAVKTSQGIVSKVMVAVVAAGGAVLV